MVDDQRLFLGLDAFCAQFTAQVRGAGPPESEHAIHLCLALGFQSALDLPVGSIVFERRAGARRIDLWVLPFDLGIEVKFHRPIPIGRSRPETQLYGGLLADFNKLAAASVADRMVVLVTDPVGMNYLDRNASNVLPLEVGRSTTLPADFVAGLPKTAAVQAVADGPWRSLCVDALWRGSCDSWQLIAWRVAVGMAVA